jgi:hypothetical protein
VQVWKSQVQEQDKRLANKEKENLPRTEEEQLSKIAQTDDISLEKPNDEMHGWRFSEDEEEINEVVHEKNDISSSRGGEENKPETSCVDDLVPSAANRKRKSAAFESVDEAERGPPIKKIRKSRRLEEKRLAKTKID